MTTNALIKGRQAIWGLTPEAGDTFAAGIIVNQTKDINGDTDFILDGQGFVIAEVFFNDKNECDINIICESETAEPERGDDMQIVGIDCIAQTCQVKWDQKGWKMLNVKATKFVNLV